MSRTRPGMMQATSMVLVLFAFGVVTVSLGCLAEAPYILLAGVLLQFASNIVFGLLRMRTRFLFLLLHGGIFLFWLTRPLIGSLYGTQAWFGVTWDATFFSLWVIYLAMVFLLAGTLLYEGCRCREGKLLLPSWEAALHERMSPSSLGSRLFIGNIGGIRIVSGALFLFCSAMMAVQACCMVAYMSGRSYEELYLASVSAYTPGFASFFSAMLAYALCAYLATLPRKRPASAALFLYIALSVPKLLVGGRADFVTACLFLAAYYVIRQMIDPKEKWITKRIVVAACAAIPVGIVLLGSITYLRAGTDAGFDNVLMSVADALYKQGVSFKVLQYGYEVNDQIQLLGPKLFVIGSLLSNITQGFFGQNLLGMPQLPDSNSVDLALYGNSYAHTMSFFAHPNYLGGEGYGSSYVLEAFADGGMPFVAALSFLFGLVFAWLSANTGRTWFTTLVGLLATMSVYRLPRAAACEWISFIWTTRFWVFLILLIALSWLVTCALDMRLPRWSATSTEDDRTHLIGVRDT